MRLHRGHSQPPVGSVFPSNDHFPVVKPFPPDEHAQPLGLIFDSAIGSDAGGGVLRLKREKERCADGRIPACVLNGAILPEYVRVVIANVFVPRDLRCDIPLFFPGALEA